MLALDNSPEDVSRHLEIAGQVRGTAAVAPTRSQRIETMARRKRWFLTAAGLVAAGFLCQLTGICSGCRGQVGIVPQSPN